MDRLKTHKLILCAALVMMLVCGIILLADYKSGKTFDSNGWWMGLAAMALIALSQVTVIIDIKKRGRK